MQVEMFLDDSDLTKILGVPDTVKISNPFYQATEFDRKGKHKDAERIYLELLNADFENPVLLAALGMNYAVNHKSGLAHALLNRALLNIADLMPGFERLGITPKEKNASTEADFIKTKHAEILNALGTCYKHENKTDAARELFDKAQSMVPLNADIQNNMATLYINEGMPEKALEHIEAGLSVDPNHAQAHWNKSLALLELGDYANGWVEYDWGMRAKVRIDREYRHEPVPVWDGSKGKKIVVFGEQGIGDEILFASCLPELIRDSELVVFDCHKKLHTLFTNSFPGIDVYPTREDEQITWPIKQDGTSRYDFDAKIAIGSLPRYYRNKREDFPGTAFLKCTEKSRTKYRDKLACMSGRPKIGISWIGGHKRTRVEVRSIELERLLPILKQDADFISLQYTPCEQEVEQFEKKHGIKIHHWPEACYNANYDETAGLVVNLDLVITVCTSLVHLAGSLGIPTWVLTPSRPAWRYMIEGERMPWYNNALLFRQPRGSTDWEPVIGEAAENLTYLLASVRHGKTEVA